MSVIVASNSFVPVPETVRISSPSRTNTAETIGRAFEPFYTTKQGGSGLGLPTTKRVIEAHGGRLLVQSEVGRGTQFTIELPVPARIEAAPED